MRFSASSSIAVAAALLLVTVSNAAGQFPDNRAALAVRFNAKRLQSNQTQTSTAFGGPTSWITMTVTACPTCPPREIIVPATPQTTRARVMITTVYAPCPNCPLTTATVPSPLTAPGSTISHSRVRTTVRTPCPTCPLVTFKQIVPTGNQPFSTPVYAVPYYSNNTVLSPSSFTPRPLVTGVTGTAPSSQSTSSASTSAFNVITTVSSITFVLSQVCPTCPAQTVTVPFTKESTLTPSFVVATTLTSSLPSVSTPLPNGVTVSSAPGSVVAPSSQVSVPASNNPVSSAVVPGTPPAATVSNGPNTPNTLATTAASQSSAFQTSVMQVPGAAQTTGSTTKFTGDAGRVSAMGLVLAFGVLISVIA
ncbi:MAG: hypothetical protein M1829_004682 [Trizodia sp. TS-e1964]|nr:MAG: hypothetical protein M1829_004682 [Trizodia sp. TS-e1964]